jgi:hypothetical protein
MPQVVPEVITRQIAVGPEALIGLTLPALTREGAAGTAYMRRLIAATTHGVVIPLPGAILQAYAPVGTGWPYQALGLKVNSLTLLYRVNVADLTSIDVKVYSVQHPVAAAIGVPVVRTGVFSGGTLVQAANVYNGVLTVTTPVYESANNSLIYGELVVVTPASSTCDLLGAVWNVDLRLFP